MAYLNILWILFTALGLILFGFTPSTVAVFAVIRKILMGTSGVKIFRTFWNTYRTEFISANKLGLILIIIGYILYIDFMYIQTLSHLLATIMAFILIVISLIFLITSIYVFPVFVHYQLTTVKYLKIALMIGLASPLYTILTGIGMVIIYFLVNHIPGLAPFFLVSSSAFLIMWCGYQSILQIEAKNGIG